VNLIRDAGRRLTAAASLDAAAPHVSSMLALCGDCHRALAVRPTPSSPTRPDVGGLVGHMLEHQRAMDELVQGLVVPSTSQWTAGAERLRTAPLRPAELLPDRGLTDEIRKAETRVHDLAGRAAQASTLEDRAAVYASLLANCSQCHGLHGAVWGPRRER
jgi:cytochrome c553